MAKFDRAELNCPLRERWYDLAEGQELWCEDIRETKAWKQANGEEEKEGGKEAGNQQV
jgi:hypothetical protein